MSNVVRVEYPDLSTELQPSEQTFTGDPLKVVVGPDQRTIIEVKAGETGVTIEGSPLDDSITGGAGADTLVGADGNDTIVGAGAADSISGGDGDDVLEIGAGDSVSGGAGADTIRIDLSQLDANNLPTISDFEQGTDVITVVNAENATDSLVFDRESGVLLLDDKAAVKLDGGLTLSASDIDLEGNDIPVSLFDSDETQVYQFYNPSQEVYFYTVSELEKDFIEDNLDNYVLQTEGFNSVDPMTGAEAEIEGIHRFYNQSTGAHLFTTSEVERDSILENLDNYDYEGVAFYGYETEVEGSMEVHRFYNPVEDLHVYTHSQSEMTEMMSDDAFNDEGVAFYAMPSVIDADPLVQQIELE